MSASEILTRLEQEASEDQRLGLARYGIPNDTALGVPMRVMKQIGKDAGRDQALAEALWQDGRYEPRTVAVFVAEPDRISPERADEWCADFDNWAICDTACFHLLDRTPFAWKKVHQWAVDDREFVRRAGFALIWGLTGHDKAAGDDSFISTFPLMTQAATDDRPLVKKAVDMALRATGKRNATLHNAARAFAAELARTESKSAQWIGRHAGKELGSEKLLSRLK